MAVDSAQTLAHKLKTLALSDHPAYADGSFMSAQCWAYLRGCINESTDSQLAPTIEDNRRMLLCLAQLLERSGNGDSD